MTTQKQILARFPSLRSISEDVGVSIHVVRKWDQRGSIPAGYWQRLINSARKRGIALKTAELLQSAEDQVS